MTTIGAVMCDRVRPIGSDATVDEAIHFLTENHIGGAPVVNAEGELLGMISELALIDVVFDPALKAAPVTRFMTDGVQSVSRDEPLARAAQLFALYAFRRLPVVENGKLVGIFTRRDLMNYVLRSGDYLTDPLVAVFPSLASVSDTAELQAEIQDVA